MELNQNNQSVESMSGSEVVGRNASRSSKSMIIGMICLAVLAVGGIGFGVWAMMDGNAKVEKKDAQIAELNSKLAGGGQSELDGIVDDEGVGDNTIMAGYIYVEEWGLKIKIPEGLHLVSYEFKHHGGKTQVEGTTVAVSGTVGDELLDFANMYKNQSSLGSVARMRKDNYSGSEYDEVEVDRRECGVDGGLIFSDDDYNYCYSHPQVDYSTSEEEKDLERRSIELIEEMLTNPDNYSKL